MAEWVEGEVAGWRAERGKPVIAAEKRFEMGGRPGRGLRWADGKFQARRSTQDCLSSRWSETNLAPAAADQQTRQRQMDRLRQLLRPEPYMTAGPLAGLEALCFSRLQLRARPLADLLEAV